MANQHLNICNPDLNSHDFPHESRFRPKINYKSRLLFRFSQSKSLTKCQLHVRLNAFNCARSKSMFANLFRTNENNQCPSEKVLFSWHVAIRKIEIHLDLRAFAHLLGIWFFFRPRNTCTMLLVDQSTGEEADIFNVKCDTLVDNVVLFKNYYLLNTLP